MTIRLSLADGDRVGVHGPDRSAARVNTLQDRCACASNHIILAGTSEQTQDFAAFCASLQHFRFHQFA